MESRSTKIVRRILSAVLTLLIIFCLFLTGINLAFCCIYTGTTVRGLSMQPTINANVKTSDDVGDKIYINPYCSFSNNDIVVAKVSWYEHEIVKRVVAVPGDRIEIRDMSTHYEVYVNDKFFYSKDRYGIDTEEFKTGSIGYYEKYLQFINSENNSKNVKIINDKTYIVMNENEYFLMGDNWGHTTDSIEKGPVVKDEILGKVELIIDVNDNNLFNQTWFMIKKVFNW